MHNVNDIVNYWNNQPCNINHGTSPIGTKQFFNEVTQKRFKAEPHIINFAKYDQYKNKKVLEIGCGIGTEAEEFAKNGCIYSGTDISEVSLNLAKQRFNVFNLNGNFYLNDFLDKTFVDNIGKFDLVYSFGVLHHYPKMNEIIKNIYHCLNPMGEFKFMVYATNSWKKAMIDGGFDQYEAQSNCPLANTYTHSEIYNILNNFNFKNIKIEQDHCFMYNINEYKKGNFILEPWFSAMPESMIKSIKKYLGWHLLISCNKGE